MINLGWQKIDLTQTVREWYGRRVHEEKLRLLVDCTGCGKRYFLHLLDQPLKFLKRKQPYLPSDPNNIKARWLPEHNSISVENIIPIPIAEGRRVTKRIAVTCHSIISCSLYKNSTSLYNNYGLKNIEAELLQQQSVEDGSYIQQYDRKLIHRELTRLILKQETPLFRAQSNIYLREQSTEPSPHRPFLVLKTEMKRMRRTRRRAIDCVGAMYGQCCKESFYVSFKALGWDDWIIAPRGYFANYCRGECGGPFRTPDTFQTFHAHFIEEYRKMGLLNGMQPCCSPVKFSSMSLIYYGVDGIIKRDLPKMVVDECGCP